MEIKVPGYLAGLILSGVFLCGYFMGCSRSWYGARMDNKCREDGDA